MLPLDISKESKDFFKRGLSQKRYMNMACIAESITVPSTSYHKVLEKIIPTGTLPAYTERDSEYSLLSGRQLIKLFSFYQAYVTICEKGRISRRKSQRAELRASG
jgi:hypothetical protein